MSKEPGSAEPRRTREPDRVGLRALLPLAPLRRVRKSRVRGSRLENFFGVA